MIVNKTEPINNETGTETTPIRTELFDVRVIHCVNVAKTRFAFNPFNRLLAKLEKQPNYQKNMAREVEMIEILKEKLICKNKHS